MSVIDPAIAARRYFTTAGRAMKKIEDGGEAAAADLSPYEIVAMSMALESLGLKALKEGERFLENVAIPFRGQIS